MKQYRITTTQIVTKISKPIEATNKEGAKNKWIELGSPTNIIDTAGENWLVEEIKEERIDETSTDSYTTGFNQPPG
jgi:cell division protein FtsL